jgi:peptidoglycan/LPS O-acetylase OafA/YrhL
MKIAHKILGILWFLLFSFILVFWFWEFVKKTSPEAGYMRVFVSPVLLFGAIVSFFVFRGARWARITMGVMALLIGVLIAWYSLETEWDELSVSVVILSLTSLALLFIPTHEPVA